MSLESAFAVTGGVYLNVPSEAMVTLPPCVVANVPTLLASTVTPFDGVSLETIVPESCTAGVVGAEVVPPVT